MVVVFEEGDYNGTGNYGGGDGFSGAGDCGLVIVVLMMVPLVEN